MTGADGCNPGPAVAADGGGGGASGHVTAVSHQQLSQLAQHLPVNKFSHIAQEFMNLQCHNHHMMNCEVALEALKLWKNRQTGPDDLTVKDFIQLLDQSRSSGKIDVFRIKHHIYVTLSAKDTDKITNAFLTSVSRVFSQVEWRTFSRVYLNIQAHDVEPLLPAELMDDTSEVERLLQSWRLREGEGATPHAMYQILKASCEAGLLDKEVLRTWVNDICEEKVQTLEEWELVQMPGSDEPAVFDPFRARTTIVREKLHASYTRQLKNICPLPWARSAGVEFDFREMYINLRTKEISTRRSSRLTRDERPMVVDDIFVNQQPSSPVFLLSKKMLVEGQPGSGKTTMCQKLAYDWASGVKQIKYLLYFELVFVVKLNELSEGMSIANFLFEKYCEGTNVSWPEFKELLVVKEDKILYLLDGFDELKGNEDRVVRFCNGELYPRATVLLTSRPIKCEHVMYLMDAAFQLVNLTSSDVQRFLRKFTDVSNNPTLLTLANEKHQSFGLISNPLMLWMLCTSYEDVNDVAFMTRTQLYRYIIDGLLKKAEKRLNITHDECLAAYYRLCQQAYLMISRDDVDFEGELHTSDADLGLVFSSTIRRGTTYISRYFFTHKSIAEFLCAAHIVHQQDMNVVKALLLLPEILNKSRRSASLVVYFVCGLLRDQNRDAELKNIFESLLESHSNKEHFNGGHDALQHVAESGVFQGLETAWQGKIPTDVLVHLSNCTQYCHLGLMNLVQSADIIGYQLGTLTVLPSFYDEHYNGDYLKHVVSAANRNIIKIDGNLDLEKLLIQGACYESTVLDEILIWNRQTLLKFQVKTSVRTKKLYIFNCGVALTLEMMAACDKNLKLLDIDGGGLQAVYTAEECKTLAEYLKRCTGLEEFWLWRISCRGTLASSYEDQGDAQIQKVKLDRLDPSLLLHMVSLCCRNVEYLIIQDEFRNTRYTTDTWIQVTQQLLLCRKLKHLKIHRVQCEDPRESFANLSDLTIPTLHVRYCSGSIAAILVPAFAEHLDVLRLDDLQLQQYDLERIVLALARCNPKELRITRLHGALISLLDGLTRSQCKFALQTMEVNCDSEEEATRLNQFISTKRRLETLIYYGGFSRDYSSENFWREFSVSGKSVRTVVVDQAAHAHLLCALDQLPEDVRMDLQWQSFSVIYNTGDVVAQHDYNKIKQLVPGLIDIGCYLHYA